MTKESTEKIQEALSLLNEAAKDKKDEINDLLTGKYKDLKTALDEVESEVSDRAGRGVERLERLRSAAADDIRSAAHRVDRKAHEDPWKTFGWAVAGAFAVGFLLARKD